MKLSKITEKKILDNLNQSNKEFENKLKKFQDKYSDISWSKSKALSILQQYEKDISNLVGVEVEVSWFHDFNYGYVVYTVNGNEFKYIDEIDLGVFNNDFQEYVNNNEFDLFGGMFCVEEMEDIVEYCCS
jgi:hypothetical protein